MQNKNPEEKTIEQPKETSAGEGPNEANQQKKYPDPNHEDLM